MIEVNTVMTPLCDLHKFWNATDGGLVVAELQELKTSSADFMKNSSYFKWLSDIMRELNSISSLTNFTAIISALPGRSVLIPLVPCSSKTKTYLLNSHNVQSIKIEISKIYLSEGERNKQKKTVLYYEKFSYQRICKVSELFFGALFNSILSSFMGGGVSDYLIELQNNPGNKLQKNYAADQNNE